MQNERKEENMSNAENRETDSSRDGSNSGCGGGSGNGERGDAKASGGQDEVMAMFDASGVSYSYGTWNAQRLLRLQTFRRAGLAV